MLYLFSMAAKETTIAELGGALQSGPEIMPPVSRIHTSSWPIIFLRLLSESLAGTTPGTTILQFPRVRRRGRVLRPRPMTQ